MLRGGCYNEAYNRLLILLEYILRNKRTRKGGTKLESISYSVDRNNRTIVNNETGEIMGEQTRSELWLNYGDTISVTSAEERQRRKEARSKRLKEEQRKKKSSQFIRLQRINWRDIIRRQVLTKAEIALVASLFPFIDWESNYIINDETKLPFNETSLAKAIHWDRKNLRPQLESLETKGILFIERAGKGKPNKYLLNPNIAFWGKEITDDVEFDKFAGSNYQPKSPINREE